MRIAILTPAPGQYDAWTRYAGDYQRLFGKTLALRPWTDTGDLSDFDLIMPLLAWGYHLDTTRWFAALDKWAGLPFANELGTLRWNANKRYLLDMEAKGVAIVPTFLAEALGPADMVAACEMFKGAPLVVKPTVSGGADGTYRLAPSDLLPADVLGREMLVQPAMAAIATEGEYSLFHFGGRFSHAVLKRPAAGDFRVQEQFGGQDVAVEAPDGSRALAAAALAAAPAPPLYARTDMVRDAEGGFRLMELELIEPWLFFAHAADKGAMFADTVRACAG